MAVARAGRDMTGLDLSGANLAKANLREALLEGVDLSGSDLSGCDLSGAVLVRAKLRDAKLAFGYSLGEASALIAAGMYKLPDLLRVPLTMSDDSVRLIPGLPRPSELVLAASQRVGMLRQALARNFLRSP